MPENNDPIRVLHFADVHIGMENYGKTDPNSGLSQRVVDFLRRMEEMVDYAKANDVDLVLFAGDAFKTRTPNPTFQREFAWRILDLAKLAPVVMLVGNHDLQPNILKASSIEIYQTLRVDNVYIADQFEVFPVDTKRGRVIVGTAPYPIRSRLLENITTRSMTIKQTDEILEQQLTEMLTEMTTEADELAGDDPRVLMGHFTVRGAKTGSERGVMLGRDVQISLGLLADHHWDYVALGHIHKHQNLTAGRDNAPPVVYSGSIERIDFGEESDDKGFCWLELQRENTSWEFVPVDARPMVTLRADCRKDTSPTTTLIKLIKKHNLRDAIVRMIVQLTPETDAMLNDNTIRDTLRDAGVFHVAGIKREIDRPDRARLGENPEGLTHMELLERYFNSRDLDEERQQSLLEAAQDLIHGSE